MTKRHAPPHQPESSRSSKKHKSRSDGAQPVRCEDTAPHKNAYEDALAKLPPARTTLGHIPAYTHFTVSPSLPPLPEITDEGLRKVVFTHKSAAVNYHRGTNQTDVSYERLEFLGDAQIEHIASRLIYERFSHLTAGAQSQLRELLVKNETLSEYARAYGFDRRVQISDVQRIAEDSRDRGNKGLNKVLGDVFEAYTAAAILSAGDDGFSVVEKWLTALWAPKLVDAARKDRAIVQVYTAPDADPQTVYDPTAKAELQKQILGAGVKLSYEPWKASEELKGDRLGQNRHYIALYLTGYGYERKLLGKGEGRNKVEAGNWAATQAMHGEAKEIVKKCAAELEAAREKKRLEMDAEKAS